MSEELRAVLIFLGLWGGLPALLLWVTSIVMTRILRARGYEDD